MKTLKVEPLSTDAFAPFGEVIEAAGTPLLINGGNTERFHDLARIAPSADGRAIVSIFRGQPRALPFVVQMLERHPLGSQAFMPLSGRDYLVVVAPPGPPPALEAVRVLLARSNQGVNYTPGTWHHPLQALVEVSDFMVIDRAGPGHNCDEIELVEPALIDALPSEGGASPSAPPSGRYSSHLSDGSAIRSGSAERAKPAGLKPPPP